MTAAVCNTAEINKTENEPEIKKYEVPQGNFYESETGIRIELETPGVSDKSVEILMDKEILTVRAERKDVIPEGYRLIHKEYDTFNGFERKFRITKEIDSEKSNAKVKDGKIILSLVFKEPLKRKIAVEAG